MFVTTPITIPKMDLEPKSSSLFWASSLSGVSLYKNVRETSTGNKKKKTKLTDYCQNQRITYILRKQK